MAQFIAYLRLQRSSFQSQSSKAPPMRPHLYHLHPTTRQPQPRHPPTHLRMLSILHKVPAPLLVPIRTRVYFTHSHSIRPIARKPSKMNATQAVLDWIAAHPYQTAFHIVNGVIVCTPAAASVPFLAALGFGTLGPTGGKSIPYSSIQAT